MRIPVLIPEETHEELRTLAFETKIPMAEHIRRAIDIYLVELKKQSQILKGEN